MKTLTLSEAFERATKGPIQLGKSDAEISGFPADGFDLHGSGPSGAIGEWAATVHGVQIATLDAVAVNAALLAHCFNHMREVESALRELREWCVAEYQLKQMPNGCILETLLTDADTALEKLNQVQMP